MRAVDSKKVWGSRPCYPPLNIRRGYFGTLGLIKPNVPKLQPFKLLQHTQQNQAKCRKRSRYCRHQSIQAKQMQPRPAHAGMADTARTRQMRNKQICVWESISIVGNLSGCAGKSICEKSSGIYRELMGSPWEVCSNFRESIGNCASP